MRSMGAALSSEEEVAFAPRLAESDLTALASEDSKVRLGREGAKKSTGTFLISSGLDRYSFKSPLVPTETTYLRNKRVNLIGGGCRSHRIWKKKRITGCNLV